MKIIKNRAQAKNKANKIKKKMQFQNKKVVIGNYFIINILEESEYDEDEFDEEEN